MARDGSGVCVTTDGGWKGERRACDEALRTMHDELFQGTKTRSGTNRAEAGLVLANLYPVDARALGGP